jgi:hypothetical protein
MCTVTTLAATGAIGQLARPAILVVREVVKVGRMWAAGAAREQRIG